MSTNVLTPFSYAQVETPEVNPENEVKTVDESLWEVEEVPEINEETPELVPEEKWELEQGNQEDEVPEDILSDVQDDIETPTTDETEKLDTESNEVDQPAEEISENEIQDEEEKIEELEKVEEIKVMDVIPDTTVTLLSWQEFNSVIKTLANGWVEIPYTWVDNNIYSFEKVDELPAWVTTWEISIAWSEYPVYARFSWWVLYYATQAETIYMNSDSSFMFNNCIKLAELNFSNRNTSEVRKINSVLNSCNNLVELSLSWWDFSNISNSSLMSNMKVNGASLKKLDLTNTKFSWSMYNAFGNLYNLTEIKLDWMDTSNVTDMKYTFSQLKSITELDLSNLNTSRVRDISHIFDNNINLRKLNLSNWDTANVVDMWYMLYNCSSMQELNLSGWNFSKVSNRYISDMWASKLKKVNLTNAIFSWSMEKAFYNLTNLEEIKLDWVNVSNVTDMNWLFRWCSSLTWLDLSSFDTSKVSNMSDMFRSCRNLEDLDLSSWDTSNLVNVSSMFSDCERLKELNLSGWDFSNIWSSRKSHVSLWYSVEKLNMTNAKFSWSIDYAFDYSCGIKEINLWWVDTSKVTSMRGVFYWCSKLTGLDLSSWNTSNVTNMWNMFQWCTSLESLNMSWWVFNDNIYPSGLRAWWFMWDAPLKKLNLTNAKLWKNYWSFEYSSELEEILLDWVDTSQITDMSRMFYGCSNLTWLDLSDFDTSNVSSMADMFWVLPNLTSLNLSGRDTSNVTNMSWMFASCSSLSWLDLSNFDTSNVTDMSYMFTSSNKIEWLNLSGRDFRKVWWESVSSKLSINTNPSLKKLNMTNAKFSWSMASTFYWLNSLEEIKLDWIDTSKVTNMSSMFMNCSNLTWLDLSTFDTSNVASMGNMFNGCSKLENLNLDNWDFRKSGVGSYLLQNTPNLKILSMSWCKIPQSFVHVMWRNWWYPNNSIEKIDVSNWDLSLTKDINWLFWDMKALKEVKWLDTWNTSNINNMVNVFWNCISLTWLDLSSWDTSRVTDMNWMFYWCSWINELNLSNFATSNVTNMFSMFYNTPNLKTIYASEKFVTTALSGDNSSKDMFSWTISVIWWNGTKFDSWYIDKTYAKIDKVWQIWYFTDKNAINVKFINTLDWTETTSTFAKWQKLTPPSVDKYHVAWWYLDEEMTQAIDLNKWVDIYSVIYVKYDRNGSSGWWGWGWSSKKTDEDAHWSAEDSQKNTQDDKNTENVIQNETKWSEESSNTSVDSSDKSSEWQGILSHSDSSFTKEQKDAYTFAKENWITTKDTIQSAQMNGKLTRIAMAKMLSQYAINVLWKTPDTSKTVKFKDVTSKKDADYDNWVTLAYQLGIMWQNMPWNNFRPNDEVTRAEFATALSRMAYNTSDWEYKATSKYYIHHMEKLVNEWIITNDNPNMKELRWYVMIMLMRSAKNK